MTLTPSNIIQQQQQQPTNTLSLGGGGGGNYSSTSPKATLRKVINSHNSAASNNVGALFETSPSPCPSNGLYAPYSDHGGVGGNNMASSSANAFARDPYSSFRSRDVSAPYGVGGVGGAGSMRSAQHPMAYAQQPPMDPAPYGTLRSTNKATNLGDGYGTARSVKKVYL